MNDKTHMPFVEKMMNHIMEGVNIPKVQIERVVGPILGMFIKEVLPKIIGSGDKVNIYPEFPLKKANNNQSTNIDWLMYNQTKNELIFLELKTANTSFGADQVNVYLDLRDKINSNELGKGAFFLHKGLETITDASKEGKKYETVLEKLKPHANELEKCSKAQIIYLVPEVTKVRMLEMQSNGKFDTPDGKPRKVDHVFCFSDLAEIHSEFPEEWKIIRNHLIAL